ncbi:VOC family protein [Streptomyces sp. TP-A0874]|uniref:VOC family protein n=1 Tax=Streptomyces sp. TP-A0874 TaxID=549819 RepID=UPI000852BB07|nr:VOC family protein [Streptomyces sp. TP-A0874]
MLTTQYVTGAPNWIDLATPDIPASAVFYRDLFGWERESLGPHAGGYGLYKLDGRTVAATGPLTEEGARSAWTVYFMAPDVDATTEAVQQAGGTVRTGPTDVFTAGRLAAYSDPTDARFAVWQPGENDGLQLVGAVGALEWTELFTPDPDAARAFYGSVFGWRTAEVPFAGTEYTLISPPDGGQDATQGGIMPQTPGAEPHWLVYFSVPDCDAAVERALALGGSLKVEPVEVEEDGSRYARLADPFGAEFAVISTPGKPL